VLLVWLDAKHAAPPPDDFRKPHLHLHILDPHLGAVSVYSQTPLEDLSCCVGGVVRVHFVRCEEDVQGWGGWVEEQCPMHFQIYMRNRRFFFFSIPSGDPANEGGCSLPLGMLDVFDPEPDIALELFDSPFKDCVLTLCEYMAPSLLYLWQG